MLLNSACYNISLIMNSKNKLVNLFRSVYNWLVSRQFDLYILIPLFVILFISLITQGSVSGGQFLAKHFVFTLLGILVFYLGYSLDINLIRRYGWIFYIASILLLILVIIKGTTALGAQRWISIGGISMQPSEPAKIACIIALASWYYYRPPKKITDLIIAGLATMLIPFGLIFIQPDLGTSLVLIFLFAIISYWAGASLLQMLTLYSPAFIMVLASLGINYGLDIATVNILGRDINIASSFLGLTFIFGLAFWLIKHYKITTIKSWQFISWLLWLIFSLFVAFIGRPFAWNLLKPYQQKRLTIFLDPSSDPLGAGYNILQSLSAVGNGGITGQKWGQGQLTQGSFVPEQHTDFIFSAVAEELGFIGAAILIICFAIIAWRLIRFASQTKDSFERLFTIGIMSIFLFHTVVNIGMNIGIMPITGVPLPFMSYGGTSVLINMFAFGIIQRIHANKANSNKRFF